MYRQLPLDPEDSPLVCFTFNGSYYVDVSLPFGLHWTASLCQDVTSIITCELTRQGSKVLSYIDDFRGGGVAHDQATPATHFQDLQELLAWLGLYRKLSTSIPDPPKMMLWLDLEFDSMAMTVTLPPDKLTAIQDLIHTWAHKLTATLHDCHTLLGKLLYIAQVCYPLHLFLNRMLDTLSQCPSKGFVTLSPDLKKDLA